MVSNERYFFTVGYSQWGRWQVRKSPVDDPYEWELVEDLGPELHAVAIEADGEFSPPAAEGHFELITEAAPWLGVITTSHKLYVKRVAIEGPNLDTAELLAENVDCVSLCRGWRSDFWEVDAGVLCAYVKTDGTVAYRCRRIVDGVGVWDAEEILTTGATSVQAVRLNDYRMGIHVEPEDKLYISERYYIGGTAKTEFVFTDIDVDFVVFSTPEVDGPNARFEVLECILVSPTLVRVTGNYPFYSLDPNWKDVSCISGNTVTGFYIQDGYLYIELETPITSELAYARFTIRGFNRLRFERTPQSRPLVPEITFDMMKPVNVSTEYVYANISTSASFHEKTMENFDYNYVEDVVVVSISTTASCSTVPLGEPVVDVQAEYVYAAISTSGSFSETMSGDVPV